MPWRYFYSTEESDTALKAILDASKFSKEYTRNENSLTDGVFEYKVDIEQDSEYQLLASKVDDAKIRALASPERVTQFGNIRPDNYFDTTKYAAGCAYRDTDTLSRMILYLNSFPSGALISQRDIDIQGTAAMGTVALVYSSKYKKTYNIPVNGSVSDRTLVKVVKDATIMTAVETSAVCNHAMYDFSDPAVHTSQGVTHSGHSTFPTEAESLAIVHDRKISVGATYSTSTTDAQMVFNFGELLSGKKIIIFWDKYLVVSSARHFIEISNDGVAYTTILELNVVGWIYYEKREFTNLTFRYLRFRQTCGGAYWNHIILREILVA